MIKLNRNFTPVCLDPISVRDGTREYIKDSDLRVWNINELKQALLDLSNEKCAYCECKVTEESKYMEVEHFLEKDNNPNSVLLWNNLLPSCKRCNGTKGTHDVLTEPVIDPCQDEPKDHLQYRLGRLRGKTELGRSTVDVIGLNDYKRSILPRHKITERIHEFIDDCLRLLENYLEIPTTRRKNVLHRKVNALLEECISLAEYSATAATALHTDPDYLELRAMLLKQSLWKDEFEVMHYESQSLALDVANISN